MIPESSLPVEGTCFGYEIRSELRFDFLREGTGESLEVQVAPPRDPPSDRVLMDWRPPAAPTHARLHDDPLGYQVWIDGAGWFGVDLQMPRITVPAAGDPVRREARAWGLPALLCFLSRGDVAIHASAVEIGGRALLLAGPPKRGKTTLASGFAAAGYRVLAEDRVCLRPGIVPSVIPGPAMLRVRRDVAAAFQVPGAVEVGRDDDRTHLSLGGGVEHASRYRSQPWLCSIPQIPVPVSNPSRGPT